MKSDLCLYHNFSGCGANPTWQTDLWCRFFGWALGFLIDPTYENKEAYKHFAIEIHLALVIVSIHYSAYWELEKDEERVAPHYVKKGIRGC